MTASRDNATPTVSVNPSENAFSFAFYTFTFHFDLRSFHLLQYPSQPPSPHVLSIHIITNPAAHDPKAKRPRKRTKTGNPEDDVDLQRPEQLTTAAVSSQCPVPSGLLHAAAAGLTALYGQYSDARHGMFLGAAMVCA